MLLADGALPVGGTIDVGKPVLKGGRYVVPFSVPNELSPFFRGDEFWFECPDAGEVPGSIAVVPAVASLIPFAWAFGCELRVASLDKTFYNSLPEIRKGYIGMLRGLELGGSIVVKELVDNSCGCKDGNPILLFSGGVDACCTLARHADERPHLITVWGADINCDNHEGWNVVNQHSNSVAASLSLDYSYVKSNLRAMIDYRRLDGLPEMLRLGFNWWHDFQHGIGLISLAAPLAYHLGAPVIYIASTFTLKDKGNYVCASDPTIDSYFASGFTGCVHDGYELSRQDKVDAIVRYFERSAARFNLRVCFHVQSGRNCCRCEKCARTILEILAAGGVPKDFGFDYAPWQFDILMWRMRYVFRLTKPFYYHDIANAARGNGVTLPRSVNWLYSDDLDAICDNGFKRGWEKFHRSGANLYHGIDDRLKGKVR